MRKSKKPDQPVLFRERAGAAPGLRRRWWLNAGLLLLIAALVAIVVYQADRNQDKAGPPLTALAADSVTRIRIEQPEQPAIVLEKTADAWRVSDPLPARANRFNVEKLLRLLAAPGETRFPAAAPDLAKFGLDHPVSRIWFDNEQIAIGALHPLNNQVYVLHHNEVALIPAHHRAAATYPYTNFLDTRLFEEDRKLVALRLPGFAITLNDGVWGRQPRDKALTSDEINDFASAWQNASALSVGKYSGERALGAVVVTSEQDGKKDQLRLGILAYKPDFVLHRPDENLEYHFTEATGKSLLNLTANDK